MATQELKGRGKPKPRHRTAFRCVACGKKHNGMGFLCPKCKALHDPHGPISPVDYYGYDG